MPAQRFPLICLIASMLPSLAQAVTPTTPLYALTPEQQQIVRTNGGIASMQLRDDFGNKILKDLYKNTLGASEKPLSEEKRRNIVARIINLFQTKYNLKLDAVKQRMIETKVSDVLNYAQTYHLLPDSIMVGAFAEAQLVVGGGFGMEWNIYADQPKNDLMSVAQYKNYGLMVGEGAGVTETYYVMMCFGACYGDDRAGYYLGVDLSGSVGVGGDFMAEVGTDVTALLSSYFRDWRSVVDNTIVTIGFGVQVGIGESASVTVNYYDLDWIQRFGSVDSVFNYLRIIN